MKLIWTKEGQDGVDTLYEEIGAYYKESIYCIGILRVKIKYEMRDDEDDDIQVKYTLSIWENGWKKVLSERKFFPFDAERPKCFDAYIPTLIEVAVQFNDI